VDDVVGEIQRDFIQRRIRVLDLLGEYDTRTNIEILRLEAVSDDLGISS
jgi:hypothetical protein